MILNMYITMMPVILAGIFNMIFVKTSTYKKNAYPIDLGKNFIDGKRILGDNKTYIGFISMIFFGIISQCIWGSICTTPFFLGRNSWYFQHENTLVFNIMTGAIIGTAYVLFELPNSFIKRRLDIPAGKTAKKAKGLLFFIIDQVDSILGVILVLGHFSELTSLHFIVYLILGSLPHISVNLCLYALKIRKNI